MIRVGRFGGRNALGLPDRFRIPARGLGQRNRKAGLVAVDDILRKQQRNMQARLQGKLLVAARLRGAHHVQDRSHTTVAQDLHAIGPDGHRAGGIVRVRHLHQLSNLFLEAHLGQQRFHARGNGRLGRRRDLRVRGQRQDPQSRQRAATAR